MPLQKSITLSRLEHLGALQSTFADLKSTFQRALGPQSATTTRRESPESLSTKKDRPLKENESLGSAAFVASIEASPSDHRPELLRLTRWAEGLEQEGIARLISVRGARHTLIRIEIPGDKSLAVIFNENGAALDTNGAVFRRAPNTLEKLQAVVTIGKCTRIRPHNISDEVLELFRQAYLEAAGR